MPDAPAQPDDRRAKLLMRSLQIAIGLLTLVLLFINIPTAKGSEVTDASAKSLQPRFQRAVNRIRWEAGEELDGPDLLGAAMLRVSDGLDRCVRRPVTELTRMIGTPDAEASFPLVEEVSAFELAKGDSGCVVFGFVCGLEWESPGLSFRDWRPWESRAPAIADHLREQWNARSGPAPFRLAARFLVYDTRDFDVDGLAIDREDFLGRPVLIVAVSSADTVVGMYPLWVNGDFISNALDRSRILPL